MNKKRGPCPSLIGGTHGSPKIEVVAGKRTCKRCGSEILKGSISIVVPTPGSMGRRVYCRTCIIEVIGKSRQDLDAFEAELSGMVS